MTEPTPAPAPRACAWPACLPDDQAAELAAQALAAERGQRPAPMPDQRHTCGCTPAPAPAPVDETPSPTWATLVEAIAELPPPPPGPYPDRGLRDRVAAALIARIKLAVVERTAPSGQIGSIFAATEYDLADVALAELAPELDALAAARAGDGPWLRAYREDMLTAQQQAKEATAALARVRELHRKATNGETCVYCAHDTPAPTA